MEATMDLERFIVEVFCRADDFLQAFCREHKLRQRGPEPVLADSEVLTIEITGEFLGIDTDQGLHAHFRRHFAHLFPGLRYVHRTTLLRQAANLWAVKQALWLHLAASMPHDPALILIDSLPVPVCRFARAHRCRRFAGLAAFGYDALAHQTYYGLRLHARVAWPGVITAASMTPANAADAVVAPELLTGSIGWALGDSAYWSPALRADLAADGLALLARPRGAAAKTPAWPRWLVQKRRRIETVFSQLTERYHAKQTWARDAWHLTSRWLRKLVSHTMAVLLCQREGLSPLAFAQLVTP
jgi:DDE family transposase